MVDLEPRTEIGYEKGLRVIGRYLDSEPSYHVSVLEVADGFAVRAHGTSDRAEGRSALFPWERLRDLVIFQAAGRGVSARRRRRGEVWDKFPNGHEDFFRALGHELDVELARSLSLDEIPEGIAVSYMRPRSKGGGSFEKYHTVMGHDEIVALLEAAQARRGTSPTPAAV
jgi:hypothetical protein